VSLSGIGDTLRIIPFEQAKYLGQQWLLKLVFRRSSLPTAPGTGFPLDDSKFPKFFTVERSELCGREEVTRSGRIKPPFIQLTDYQIYFVTKTWALKRI